MLIDNKSWSLFVEAYDGNQSCQSMVADYRLVDNDPNYPPYEQPCLHCTALDELLNLMPKFNDCIPF